MREYILYVDIPNYEKEQQKKADMGTNSLPRAEFNTIGKFFQSIRAILEDKPISDISDLPNCSLPNRIGNLPLDITFFGLNKQQSVLEQMRNRASICRTTKK